ncbi:MAG: hypothetical protein FWG24_04930 [Eggerthellaceae bacterium]|jgi:uncharacterized protein YxeA|nr:hypothetical protein [Eggerthellaceae bacterium]MDR2721786.1 hypothetical protein [Coriobacteriaceae bacterium]
MRRRLAFYLTVGVSLVLLSAFALVAKQYYNDHYVGSDYYAMIPTDYDVSPQAIPDGNIDMGPGVEFELPAYNEEGEVAVLSFRVFSPESDFYHGDDMPQPGDYLLIKASKHLVVGWDFVEENKIPIPVLSRISLLAS